MSFKRIYIPWLAPLYKRVPFARCLLWQARFLTDEGARNVAIALLPGLADELTFTRDALHWTVALQDAWIVRNLFLVQSFERETVIRLLQWVRKTRTLQADDVILELGGNIGTSTLPFAQLTPCRIVAVEPVPRNLALLKKNIAQNNFAERVTVVERAVTTYNGEIEMIVPLVARGGSEIAARPANRTEPPFQAPCEMVRVQTTRVDTLLHKLQIAPERVALVWCDVQGSDDAVLVTGEALWRAGVPLWTEIAPVLLARQGSLPEFVTHVTTYFRAFVPRLQFETVGIDAAPFAIETFADWMNQLTGDAQTDVLFLPRAAQDH